MELKRFKKDIDIINATINGYDRPKVRDAEAWRRIKFTIEFYQKELAGVKAERDRYKRQFLNATE